MKVAFLALLTTLAGVAGYAQPEISRNPWEITHVEGRVYLNGQPVQQSVSEFPKITENSVISTEDGRAEIVLTPGVTLHLRDKGSLRMIANSPNHTHVELLTGSAVALTDHIAKETRVTVACEGVVTLSSSGEYRFDTHVQRPGLNFCQFSVYKGSAQVQLETLKVVVKTGQTMWLNHRCGDHTPVNELDIKKPLSN
jgi:hypothetical protein